MNETAVLSCLWQENGGARWAEGAQLVRQPKKTDRDGNQDKQERIIVTPVSENSYMWPIRDTLDRQALKHSRVF